MCFGDLTIQNALGSVAATVMGETFQRRAQPVCLSYLGSGTHCCFCLGCLSFQNLESYILYNFPSLRPVTAMLTDSGGE